MHLDILMTQVYKRIVRPYIFRKTRRDPEVAHEWVLEKLTRYCESPEKLARLRKLFRPINDPVTIAGITFRNRVGLAAGYDKNAVAVPAFAAMGFGFGVVGTVTWDFQKGNDQPRQWRLLEDQALVNYMGFNNDGLVIVNKRIERLRNPGMTVGVSIGKSKNTPNEQAAHEYGVLSLNFVNLVDFIEVNVTSPNTPGLRNLLEPGPLREILQAIGRRKPVFFKLSPDSSREEVENQVSVCLDCGVDAVTICNTTVRKNLLFLKSKNVPEVGGVSGKPLFRFALELVKHVHRITNGKLPIIAVGGIMSADDAKRMMDNGASLVQTFTGLVYNGPWFARTLARELKKG